MTCERTLDRGQVQEKLKLLAEEITEDLSRLESAQSKELLSDFVSELFLSMAKQDQQAVRRQKQAEGIAAAKARGVRFGPSRKPLPENFSQYYRAWQSGKMTLTQAAETCGMTRASFYRAVDRMKQLEGCSA
ncbi:hypothetical protein AALA82_17010 [Oscillospiraceae bacterium 50-16]